MTAGFLFLAGALSLLCLSLHSLALPCPAFAQPAKTAQTAPASILDATAVYLGPAKADITGATEIRIGFFAPAVPDRPVGYGLWRGAQLALAEQNAAGGVDGLPFRLVPRWDDDPWRGGSREAVRLIYEDEVLAVIGGPDAESTHVIEQVATKARFPMIAPTSGDPSLTLTAVPWIFRLAPGADVQAEAMADAALAGATTCPPMVVVLTGRRESRAGGEELARELRERQCPPYLVLTRTGGAGGDALIAERLAQARPVVVFYWGSAEEFTSLAQSIEFPESVERVLLPLGPREVTLPGRDYRIGRVVETCYGSEPWEAFAERFRERYGAPPDIYAGYGYDALNLIAEGARRAGLNRSRLREALAGRSGTEGVTGRFRWDAGGGNMRRVEVQWEHPRGRSRGR